MQILPSPLIVFCSIVCAPLALHAARGTASASSGAGDFAPAFAVDGNPATRWSSDCRDNEWWQFSFDEPHPLAGLRILWENAFAEIYHIAVSDDTSTWRTVASMHDGDGQTDLLFFAPVTARHVRIVCEQRGTGWGNSIWELSFIPPQEAPRITASSCVQDSPPAAALDGSLLTAWHAGAAPHARLHLAFHQPEPLSGLVLHWAASNVTFCCMHTTNNVDWLPLAPWQNAHGGATHVAWPPLTTSVVRIECAREG